MKSIYPGLFSSETWSSVIQESYRASVTHIEIDKDAWLPVIVFKKGPFKLAYPHFPGVVESSDLDRIVSAADAAGLDYHVMRCLARETPGDSSQFGIVAELPETIVHGLQEFDPNDDQKLRRAIRRANRYNTRITSDLASVKAEILYELYRNTISARRGSLRYNLEYFEALLKSARTSKDLSVLVAYTDDILSGFLVIAMDNGEAHYLHSAYHRDYASFGITDLLVQQGLTHAREKGAESFNFGVSPVNQPELTRFKEKWGGTTSTQYTLDYTRNIFWGTLFRVASRILALLGSWRN